jgi:hypothetical protein
MADYPDNNNNNLSHFDNYIRTLFAVARPDEYAASIIVEFETRQRMKLYDVSQLPVLAGDQCVETSANPAVHRTIHRASAFKCDS